LRRARREAEGTAVEAVMGAAEGKDGNS